MQAGQRFGAFVVEARLGAGGMGVVYRVRHEGTGVLYALKVLAASADPEEVRRFVREGEALAAVDDHPHLVRVHAAGEVDGRRFLLLQLCTGGDLRARLRAGGLSADEAARVVLDVARGIAHVHAHAIVHRDLKPENVLFDDAGRTRVSDFGLARVAGAESLTATGTLLGTPAYMAPEQADAGEVDARTDVWALGGLLIAALTGRAPYQGAMPINVLAKLLKDEPRWPSADRPDTPPALEAIVRRAMAREPERRYPTAAAMADDLERFLRRELPSRRGRAGVALAAGTVLLLLGAAAWSLRPAGRGSPSVPEPSPEEAPRGGSTASTTSEERTTAAPTWHRAPEGVAAVRVRTPTDPKHLLFVDATRLLVAHDGGVSLLDLGAAETRVDWPQAWVRGMAIAGGQLLVARHSEATASLFTLDPRTLVGGAFGTFPIGSIASFSCSADGGVLAVGSMKGEVHVAAPAPWAGPVLRGQAEETYVAVRRDGGAIACGVGRELHVLRPGPAGWRRSRVTDELPGVVRTVAFVSVDEVVVGTTFGSLVRMSITSGESHGFSASQATTPIRAHRLPIRDVVRFGDVLLSAASKPGRSTRESESELRAWDLITGAHRWSTPQPPGRALWAVALSPGGEWMALGYTIDAADGASGVVEVWKHPD